ncbi:MAG: carotenoid oxygenase family protein, partial [Sciscionella sp.]|nr:carotenoid oxygenase family protein [Sciscionella sp.]
MNTTSTPTAGADLGHSGNFAPVHDELDVFNLPVTGEIPAQLSGRYLRNGPNPRRPDDHWFTGDGMVHGVRVTDGRARWYRNRYVRTDSFDDPFPLYNADGSRNLHASVANTHVVRHAGKLLALVESSLPYEITGELETVGCFDFAGRLRDSMTAHPKICPVTGELHFFGYGNLHEPYVTYHRANVDGELIVEQPVDVPGLTMMHDFCLTQDYVIFLDLPVVFRMDLALGGASLPYRWSDEYGARLGVMRRADPAAAIRWFEITPCYVFHI